MARGERYASVGATVRARLCTFRGTLRDAVACVVAVVCCLSVGWWGVGFNGARPDVPIVYGGDAAQYSYLMEADLAGSLADIRFTGAPLGTQHLDFPSAGADYANRLIARRVAAPGRFGERYNRFYLVTFALTALAGFAVARAFGIGRALAAGVAIAFSVLPFHFQREGHLFYQNYSATAVGLWLALQVFLFDGLPQHRRDAVRTLGGLVLASLWIGTTGVYFAFFSCILVSVAAAIGALERGVWRPLAPAALALAVIVGCGIVQLYPSIRFHVTDGENTRVGQRVFQESEVYGLKIAQMVLPVQDHRIRSLAKLRRRYDEEAPLITENSTATLGVLGTAGFVLSLLALLVPRLRRRLPGTIQFAAIAVLSMTLYGTIGGFGSLFALLVAPDIRGLNRVSPMIGLAALVVLAGTLQWLAHRHRRPWLPSAAAAVMVLVAVVDQVPDRREMLQQRNANQAVLFDNDRAFALAVRRELPRGAAVLQLPFVEYPEVASGIGRDYTQLRNVLHALDLRWSYGAMKGRPESNWLYALTTLPPPRALQALRTAGFSAIVVDERGRTPWITDVAARLQQSVRTTVIASADGTQTAYVFAPDAHPADVALVAPGQGWYPPELDGDAVSIWSSGTATIAIRSLGRAVPCRMPLTLRTIGPRAVEVSVDGELRTSLRLTRKAFVSTELALTPGDHQIVLRTAKGARRGPKSGDVRRLAIQWRMPVLPLCG